MSGPASCANTKCVAVAGIVVAAVLLPFGIAAVALGLAPDVRGRRPYATFVHVAGLGAAGVALGILMP